VKNDLPNDMTQAWKTIVAVSCACACGTSAAQGPGETASGVAACAAIESAVARLDCFDELARRARADDAGAEAPPSQAPAAGRQPPASATPNAAPPDTPQRLSRRDARAAERAEHEVTSHVAAVREIQPGRIEVTLANGQVWRQTNSDRYNLLVGHDVRLYPSGFGQYFRLSSKELRGFIQVERVR
jgi:hypothetical protein